MMVSATLAVLLSGCASTNSALVENQSRPYPQAMERSPTVPIQVIRRSTHIEMTNTTARAYGASTIWLNGRYSRSIEGLAIGQTLRLDLREFYDQWGDSFRAGGFFATRDPDGLVLVEIESGDALTGLVMVGNIYE
jgi:hypothetical protein